MRTNAAGIELIKRFEPFRPRAVHRSGVWVIGYGHTGDVEPHHVINEHQAEAILSVDLDCAERVVLLLADGAPLTENQFSALVSFTLNAGMEAFKRSRLLRYVRAGAAVPSAPWARRAASEFDVWARCGATTDLVERRRAERALFETV